MSLKFISMLLTEYTTKSKIFAGKQTKNSMQKAPTSDGCRQPEMKEDLQFPKKNICSLHPFTAAAGLIHAFFFYRSHSPAISAVPFGARYANERTDCQLGDHHCSISQFCELSSGDRNKRHQLLENELGARKREKHTNQSSSGYIWMRAEVFLKTTQVVFNNVSRSMQCIWQIGINKTTVFTWF